MARDLLKDILGIFDNAKEKARQAAQSVKQTAVSIPQNLRATTQKVQQSEPYKRITGQYSTIGQSKPSDYFVFSPQALRSGQKSANLLGNTAQRWGQTTPQTPSKLNTARRTTSNFLTNFFKVAESGMGNAAAGSQNIATGFKERKPLKALQGGGQFLYGSGTAALNAVPAYHAINAAASLDKPIDKNDIVRRTATGFLQGMSGAENLSPQVPRQMQKFFGAEFDPAMAGGQMLGFVKHPVNQKLFQLTDGIKLPILAEKIAGNPGLQRTAAKVANFMVTNGVRGTVEDIIMNLQDMPENATSEEKIKFLAERGLMGAASEIVGRAFFGGSEAAMRGIGKFAKGKLDQADMRPVVEFLEDLQILSREAGPVRKTPETTTRKGPRSAEDIIRDARGRFSTEPAEIPRKPEVDWVPDPENPSRMIRTEDGVRWDQMPKEQSNQPLPAFKPDAENPNRMVRVPNAKSRLNPEAAQPAMGLAAGIEIERDENGKPTGKVNFNPTMGWGGFFAVGAMQNRKAIGEYGQQVAKNFAERAGKNTDDVLEWYRNDGYRSINKQLRSGEKVTDSARSVDDAISKIDEITGKPLGKDMELYRGVISQPEQWLNAKVGDTITDKGFVSTARSGARKNQSAKEYAAGAYTSTTWKDKGDTDVVLKIKAGPETPGYIVKDDVDPEVLLARGQQFKVISKTQETISGKNVNIIELEVQKAPTAQPQTPDEFINTAREEIKRLPEEPKVTWKEAWDRFYTDWVDRFHPIVQAADAVEKGLKEQGAQLRPEFNPKYQIRRFLGVGGIAESKFRDEVQPILKQLDEQGIDKLDMDAYLKARRDINLGERGIKGSDPVKAQATVQAFEAKYGPEKLQGVATQLYDYQNKLFDELVDAGFVKPDVAERIKATNADYVPFQRVMDDDTLDEFLGIPTKKVVQGTQPLQKIKGSERDIYSPIESIIANTYKYTAAVEKNKTAQSIARLQEIMPEIGFSVAKESGADTIPVWIDGAKQHIKVGKDIADAAKGMNEEQMNNVLKILQFPAQVLRSGATGQNPEFMIPNVVRDQFEAALYSNYGYKPFIDYFRGMAHLINKSRTGSDEIVDAWMKSGASQELSSMSGRKTIQEFFNQKTGKKGLFGWIGDALEFMGKYSEQPTRVGLFERAKNKTNNDMLAMFESRDATLDFSRMGSKMKVANSLVPFLNVGVQGFDKLIRQTKNKPADTAVKVAIYGLLPQMASTMYNLLNHPDEYAEIPQFEKDKNFVFISGRNDDGTIDYYTVPKAESMTNFVNPMESFLSYMAGTNQQGFGEFATSFLSGALPVVGEGSSLHEVGVRTIGQVMPQAAKPLAENLLNKSFFRYNSNKQEAKEIVPYYLKNKAPGDQSYNFTPDTYKVLGKIMNVSPLQVQNIAEGYLAGYAKVPTQIINLLTKASRNEEITPNEKTLLRRFAKQTYPTSESQQKAKKKQAEETPLIPQAGAVSSIPAVPSKSDAAVKTSPDGTPAEDNRNWFQKLFNIELDKEPEATKQGLPSGDKELGVVYKDAQSILRSYEEKKIKYQYGRYDESTDIQSKLDDLEADKQWAEGIMAQIEEKYPEKVIDFEINTYKSGGGATVPERAEWAVKAIDKLAKTGDSDKVTELIDKLWDEKVLTSGDSGVAKYILDELGIDLFNYGSDPKKSKGGKSSGKSSASSKIQKEMKKLVDQQRKEWWDNFVNLPKIGGRVQTPQSQVDWTNTAPEATGQQSPEFQSRVPEYQPMTMEQFFSPKAPGVSPEAARVATSVRGGGNRDDRLRLRYAGGGR